MYPKESIILGGYKFITIIVVVVLRFTSTCKLEDITIVHLNIPIQLVSRFFFVANKYSDMCVVSAYM